MENPAPVIYLHGLESDPGGPKVAWLEERGPCLAPAMRYREPHPWPRLLEAVDAWPHAPALVVGSSMGGYFGWHLGHRLGIAMLLFNPALGLGPMPAPIDVAPSPAGPGRVMVVCGADDDVIDPDRSGAWLATSGARVERVIVAGMGHRTPFDIFTRAVSAALASLNGAPFVDAFAAGSDS